MKKSSFKKIMTTLSATALITILTAKKALAFSIQEGAEAARADGMPADLFGETGAFRQITKTILYIVGILAVIMLIWGGIRYVVSGGDSKKVTDAKNTILYAIIGLVISFFAFAIVNFILNALPSSDDEKEAAETALIELPRA